MLTASAQQPTAQPPQPAAQQPTSQQPPANQALQKQSSNDNGDTVISVTTQLVIETVTVTDKSGKGIEGLTAKDFAVTEDNAPQTIKFFDYEKLPETPEPLPPAPENVTVLNKFPKSRITSEQPGSTRYKDHRLLALYFDMSALPPLDQLRSLDGARKFIKEKMTKADLVAIMLHQGGAVDVLQDFTDDDRNRLLTILETIAVGESQGFDEVVADDSAADTGAAFGQDDSEFNLFTTDRQLAALQTAATMLGHLSERKQVLYFASGLHLNGLDNQAQLHATVNAASARRRSVLDDRRPRPGRLRAPWPTNHGSAWRPGHVLRFIVNRLYRRFPGIAGHDVYTRRGHRRQSSTGQQRSLGWHRKRPEGGFELLHHRLLRD